MMYSGQTIMLTNRDGAQIACKQVTLSAARKVFNAGGTVWLHPCNMALDNIWQAPIGVIKTDDVTFEALVNSFKFYTCNSHNGDRVIYFVAKHPAK